MTEERFLLDTQIVLWALNLDPRLSQNYRDIFLGNQPKYVSIVSLWEIAIKTGIGKLKMPPDLLATLEASDVMLLPIAPNHVLHTATLPHHHGDPFDRLLIAQAQLEGLTLVTADKHFALYDVVLT